MESLAVIDGKVTCVLGTDRLSDMLQSATNTKASETGAQPVEEG
jgi:hypothetical protein